jgi:hypothetical protein
MSLKINPGPLDLWIKQSLLPWLQTPLELSMNPLSLRVPIMETTFTKARLVKVVEAMLIIIRS